MGYVTYFSGQMEFSNKKSYDFAKECFNLDDDSNYSLYDSDYDDKNLIINICEDWKDYDDAMMSICSMALYLDKDVKINIDCSGEENGDLWEIRLVDRKLIVNNGRIVYDDVRDVDEEGLKTQKYLQRLYDVTKDDKLLKELVINKLESEDGT